VECYLLSFLFCAALFRIMVRRAAEQAIMRVPLPTEQDAKRRLMLRIVGIIFGFVGSAVLSLVLIGLLTPITAAIVTFEKERRTSGNKVGMSRVHWRQYLISLIVMLFLAFCFFVWNFQAQ
jgi:hypothetical protein